MPITEEYVKQLHRILKSGLMAEQNPEVVVGEYKKYANVKGGIITANWQMCPDRGKGAAAKIRDTQRTGSLRCCTISRGVRKNPPVLRWKRAESAAPCSSRCALPTPFQRHGIDERHKMFYYMGLKEWQQEHQPKPALDVFLSMQDDMKAVLDYFKGLPPTSEQTSRTDRHIPEIIFSNTTLQK